MENNKIGNFIASLRREKGLTQKQLGDKLFVTDKAVSKWERGRGLPDINLLNQISKILDVEVTDILSGKRNSEEKINIEDKIKIIKTEIEQKNKIKAKRAITIMIILLLLISYLIFRNAKLGYNLENVYYSHSNKNINIGISKTSFMLKNNDRSYSYKNLRNANIIETEIKNYLKTLKYSTCNDTIYYYDEKSDFSLIEYSVKNHIFYSTISYEIVDYDYCEMKVMEQYATMLGGLRRVHSLNGSIINNNTNWNTVVEVMFFDDIDNSSVSYKFLATMKIRYYKKNSQGTYDTYTLEDSKGYYEIKDNKLYYYRTKIVEESKEIDIPEVSVFEIDDGNLILIDNYLSSYQEKIELK